MSTIPLQITNGKSEYISNEKLHSHTVLSAMGDKLVINFLSRLSNYQYPLSSKIREIELNSDQYKKYRYRPKTLSYDLYGTIELATALMRINGCVSICEFDFAKLKVFNLDIMDVLREVMNKERNRIMENNNEITTDIREN